MRQGALLIVSVLLGLVLLELGCRLVRGPKYLVEWPNLVWSERAASMEEAADDGYDYDPMLGWSLQPNFSSEEFSVDGEGFRRTPGVPVNAGPPVLALGGSHVMGSYVADAETWPVYLQDAAGRRIINGGVTSYGLDQTLLQAEKIVPLLKPAMIVIAFSGENVANVAFSRQWYADKPYFRLTGETLVLHNVPVPPPVTSFDMMPWPQRVFGWSMLVDTVAAAGHFRNRWLGIEKIVLTPGEDERLVCPIMRRLAKLPVPTLAVGLADRKSWTDPGRGLHQRKYELLGLRCAREAGMATLDLHEETRGAIAEHGIDALYRDYHYSLQGNRLIARAIAREIAGALP